MTNEIPNPSPFLVSPSLISPEEQKRLDKERRNARIKRWLPAAAIGIVALFIGVGIGGSGASEAPAAAEPAPTVTVIEEMPAAVLDDGCKAVAVELHSMLSVGTNDIMIVQNEVIQTLIDNLLNGVDVAQIQDATAKMNGITTTTNGLTSRIGALAPAYDKCVNP